MSWYKNYKIYFQSRIGTQYCVYILEQTEGTSHTLLGAAEPFVTQEDDNDDIFTPIRKQTGYLRIVGDPNVDIMEVLMPKNNVEKMVQLWSGTWNSDMTTFTDGTLQWQGFLVAQAFSQPAENGRHIIEFPVKSMLGALEDVYMPYDDAIRYSHLAYLLARASNALMKENSMQHSPWATYYFSDDVENIIRYTPSGSSPVTTDYPAFGYPILNWNVFVEDINTKNQGAISSTTTYYDALSQAAMFYGLCIREKGASLYLQQYDNAYECYTKSLTWGALRASGGTSLMPHTNVGKYQWDTTTMSSIVFVTRNSQKNYVPGASDFEVLVNLRDIKLNLGPGSSVVSSDTPYQIPCINSVTVLAQPHDSSVGSYTETFSYWHYNVRYLHAEPGSPLYERILLILYDETTSTFDAAVNQSVMVPSGRNRFMIDSGRTEFVTAAFPVRWSTGGVLKSALWLNCIPTAYPDTGSLLEDEYHKKVIYKIESGRSVQFGAGFLNLNFTLNRFMLGDSNYITWNENPMISGTNIVAIVMEFGLAVGSSYFGGFDSNNNPIWSTDASTVFRVVIMNDGTVSSNVSSYPGMTSGGYYIPVDNMQGTVTLQFYNTFINGRSLVWGERQVFCAIMAGLALKYIPRIVITGTEDGENRYYDHEDNGFAGSKNIETIIGTDNANQQSSSFLMAIGQNNGYTPIQEFTYRTLAGTETFTERPEMHLLDRMVAHGSEVRKNITYCVRSFVADLMQTIYQKGSKYFFGVDAKHDWREDEQEIKFIEITDEI